MGVLDSTISYATCFGLAALSLCLRAPRLRKISKRTHFADQQFPQIILLQRLASLSARAKTADLHTISKESRGKMEGTRRKSKEIRGAPHADAQAHRRRCRRALRCVRRRGCWLRRGRGLQRFPRLADRGGVALGADQPLGLLEPRQPANLRRGRRSLDHNRRLRRRRDGANPLRRHHVHGRIIPPVAARRPHLDLRQHMKKRDGSSYFVKSKRGSELLVSRRNLLAQLRRGYNSSP